MPSAADLRRLADELQRAGQQSDRTARLLAAADAGERGTVREATWRPDSLEVYVDGIEGPRLPERGEHARGPGIVRSAPFPGAVAAFLREEAAGKVEEATQAIHGIAGDAGSAARFGASAKAADGAANLLRAAATLEEVAGACDRGQGVLHIYGTSLCIRARDVGHVVVHGAPYHGASIHGSRGGTEYYGVQGACCHGRVCADTHNYCEGRRFRGQPDEVLLYTQSPDLRYPRTPCPEVTRIVGALVAAELRAEVGLARTAAPAALMAQLAAR